MQTEMIAKSISISYICPKCGFRYTSRGGLYGNDEFMEKIIQRLKNSQKKCMMCNEAFLEPKSIKCDVYPVVNQNYYEIKWECEKCNTKWRSIHDITPGTANFGIKLAEIKNATVCINEACKSNKVKTVALTYHRKV